MMSYYKVYQLWLRSNYNQNFGRTNIDANNFLHLLEMKGVLSANEISVVKCERGIDAQNNVTL